jgi:acyl-CoA reductase-like NAD-dependent aldehyde dehydrogenase
MCRNVNKLAPDVNFTYAWAVMIDTGWIVQRRTPSLEEPKMTSLTDRTALFIDGAWRAPDSSETIRVVSPFTEQEIGSFPASAPTDVDAAVSAARKALRRADWAELSPAERAGAIRRFADELEKRSEDRAVTVTHQNGMPIELARFAEGAAPVQLLRYYAGLAESTPTEERRASQPIPGTTIVRREPAGVVAAIAPWNFPAVLSMFKIAPALAAGCTVVLKPSPETTLDSYVLAEAAIAAELPAGVINIVTGGPDIGQYLVAHPGVDKVAFTGSTAAGRHIGTVCGGMLRPVTLELGWQVGGPGSRRRGRRGDGDRSGNGITAQQWADVLYVDSNFGSAQPQSGLHRRHHCHV